MNAANALKNAARRITSKLRTKWKAGTTKASKVSVVLLEAAGVYSLFHGVVGYSRPAGFIVVGLFAIWLVESSE